MAAVGEPVPFILVVAEQIGSPVYVYQLQASTKMMVGERIPGLLIRRMPNSTYPVLLKQKFREGKKQQSLLLFVPSLYSSTVHSSSQNLREGQDLPSPMFRFEHEKDSSPTVSYLFPTSGRLNAVSSSSACARKLGGVCV